jgi:HAMP domain-containing protein
MGNMGIFLRRLAGMRLQLQARWLVIGVCVIVLTTVLLVYISISRTHLAEAQELIRISEVAVTENLQQLIQLRLTGENWSGDLAPLIQKLNSARPNRVLITNMDGSILFDSGQTPTLPPNFLTLIEQTALNTPQATWRPGQEILFTAAQIELDNPRQTLVLARLVDHSQSLEKIRLRQATDENFFGMVLLSLTGLIAALFWLVLLRPLRQLEYATQVIASGSDTYPIPNLPTVELNQLGQSVTQMVEKISEQRAALEDLNAQLEERVKRRTGELHNATLNLKQRTVEMQSLNTLMATAFNAESLQDLADHAIQDAARVMQATSGHITFFSCQAAFNLPSSAASLFAEIASQYGYQAGQEIYFHDWQSPTLPARLLEVGKELTKAGNFSSIGLPIQVGRETIGRLWLSSSFPNRWQERDFDLGRIISRQVGAAAERIRDFEDAQFTNRLMARLIIYSERLNQSFNNRELVDAIGNSAQELTGVQQIALFMLDSGSRFACAWSAGWVYS